jgi:hypothetical protein
MLDFAISFRSNKIGTSKLFEIEIGNASRKRSMK